MGRAAFVVINPAAGRSNAAGLRAALDKHLAGAGWHYRVYETTGREDLADIVRGLQSGGVDMGIVAGGDGTISDVASALVHTALPLGVVPVGTGNALARALAIPLDLDRALRLLVGEHAVRRIDAMHIRGRHYVLNAGVGVSALMARDTARESKRRFGYLVYVWTILRNLPRLRSCELELEVDGRRAELRANEALVLNCATVGAPHVRLGEQVRPDDGRLEVYVVQVRTALDPLRLAREALRGRPQHDPSVQAFTAERYVSIHTEPSLVAQADGDVIGRTPLRVEVVPSALQVIVPLDAAGRDEREKA